MAFDDLRALANALYKEYQKEGGMTCLSAAIVVEREALNCCPQGNPNRAFSLDNLGCYLFNRYQQVGGLQDLEEAITIGREALELRPQGHQLRSSALDNLAAYLYTRYQQAGALQDIEEAIVLGREALSLCPDGHPLRSSSLDNVGLYLCTRYKLVGTLQDLEEAIAIGREALDLCPQGNPSRNFSLINLGSYLHTRYKLVGALQDLEEAIKLLREALDLCPTGHPLRSSSLTNLGLYVSLRFTQLGAPQDLEEAITLEREALGLCPKGHHLRPSVLSHLGSYLQIRYGLVGVLEDLGEAILVGQEMLDLCPKGHPLRSSSLVCLASYLSRRYQQAGALQDLEEAIVLGREALDLCPQGHPRRPFSLVSLGSDLCHRYRRLGDLQDLEEAIVFGREALDLSSQGSLTQTPALMNLVTLLRTHFLQSDDIHDLHELFGLYVRLEQADKYSLFLDLSALAGWILTAELVHHPSLLLAYETALRFLVQHLASLPSLPRHLTIFKERASQLAVDAFSACIRHSAPALAVELLEQGHGVFWNQLIRLRSPLDDVILSDPAGITLADHFRRVSLDIDTALNTPNADQHEKLWHLNLEITKVATSIRQLPGQSRFLLPSLFSDLRRAACGGPVIIVNASNYSCDALIVFLDQDPVHIPLRITRKDIRDLSNELRTLIVRAKRANTTQEFAVFLRKIWDLIVSPIVAVLQTTVTLKSRIWWCPTAEFSPLPLHAASPFRKGQRSLADLYISSYTPTLTALIRARQFAPPDSIAPEKRFVAIGQAAASGEKNLPSVGVELDNIEQLINSLTTFTRVDGEQSCVSRIIEELEKNEWVHFACHGIPCPARPFESAFALHDGPFTVQHMIGCKLKNPEFAYLSACHTTVGYEDTPDEAIHLASAMQFVGFRSVIGTMWAVDDSEAKKITSVFYKHMVDESGRLDYTRAAYALNKTMKSVNVSLDQQILYVHIGA